MITSIEQLEAIYGTPGETSMVKELDHINAEYRRLIEASCFAVLATGGPEGFDCSPRGDAPGFVRVHDERTLMLPDRQGNNRIDSLRNIVRNPRAALLFLIPGSGTTLRVNGNARISAEKQVLDSFAVNGKPPRTIMVLSVEAVYFQCSRAIVRSDLWNPAKQADAKSLPSIGQILAVVSKGRVGGESYDREWPARAKASLW